MYPSARVDCTIFLAETGRVRMTYKGLDHWWRGVRFEFDPMATVPSASEILVGLGDPMGQSNDGVVLSNVYRGSTRASVSDFVLNAESATVERWRERFGNGWNRIERVVLEDLSLDSCFALLLFEARLRSEESLLPRFDDWCSYVTRWEQGFVDDRESIGDSIAMLATTLGHSYFVVRDGQRAAPIDTDLFNEGAHAVIEFLALALGVCKSPAEFDAGRLPRSKEVARAQVHLAYEQDSYERARLSGTSCQLAVPLHGSGRRMLVDALLVEERTPSALLKVFARRDKKNSRTGRGFELLGLYRPALRGTGNDMVFSVSKESGLSLKSLWAKLEQLENEAWGVDRPRDHPRRIQSYRQVDDCPNQPWWDDNGIHSLIAAPKSLRLVGEEPFGSKLNWSTQVLPALWECYSPIPADIQIEDVAVKGQKVLSVCRWPRGPASQEFAANLLESPTLCAWLKTRSSMAWRRTCRPMSPAELPEINAFKTLPVSGGVVVIDREGVTVLDDWTETEPPIADITAVFTELTQRESHLKSLLDDVQDRLDRARQAKHAVSPSDLEEWKSSVLAIRSELLAEQARDLINSDTGQHARLRSEMSPMLAPSERVKELVQAVDWVDRSFTEKAEHRLERNRRLAVVIGSGLACAFATSELSELAKPLIVGNVIEVAAKVAAGPAGVMWLSDRAHILHTYEVASALLVMAAALLGGVLYWRFGSRIGSE